SLTPRNHCESLRPISGTPRALLPPAGINRPHTRESHMSKNAIPVLSLKNVKTGSHTSEKSGRQYMTIPGNIVMLENGQRARLYVSDVYLTDPETGRSMRTQEIRLSLIEEKPVVHTVAPQ